MGGAILKYILHDREQTMEKYIVIVVLGLYKLKTIQSETQEVDCAEMGFLKCWKSGDRNFVQNVCALFY